MNTGGSPALNISWPSAYSRRSLLNASSFCMDGSVVLKIGTLRISSNSCSRLMVLFL